jgi:two-component system response regulator NreC
MRTPATLEADARPDQGTSSRPGHSSEIRELDRSEPITIVLGAFSSLLTHGLINLLEKDGGLRVVDADVEDGELENVVTTRRPCVAVLDEQSVSDLSLPARLRAAMPAIALVVLAFRPTRAYCLRMLGVGASACLCKDASAAEILSAVRLVAEGRHLLASLSHGHSEASERDAVPSLTPREREVLRLVSVGQTDSQIALALHIGTETARSHVRHVCRKLEVSKRRELIGR